MDPSAPRLSAASANRPESLLVGSARRGDIGGIRAALAAKPSMAGGLEMSGAFHAAVAGRKSAVVAYLLDLGVDPNCHGPEPAVVRAVRNGDLEMLRLLLDRGADPNAARLLEDNALAKAEFLGQTEAARLILAAGGAPSRRGGAWRWRRWLAALAAALIAGGAAALAAYIAPR